MKSRLPVLIIAAILLLACNFPLFAPAVPTDTPTPALLSSSTPTVALASPTTTLTPTPLSTATATLVPTPERA